MVLTGLQRRIMHQLATNRSETSFVAGGAALNKDWPRRSDDIDIFHGRDDEVGPAATRDIETLERAGFGVRVEVEAWGIFEVVVSEYGESTRLQWMSDTKRRFLPLVRDEEWGVRLAPADLAVNKVLAAASRRQARDAVDLALIGQHLCPLGPLVMAAPAKPPHFSPGRILEGLRRNPFSLSDEEFVSVRGIPDGWTFAGIRDRIFALVEQADAYVTAAPPALVGRLALNRDGIPVEVSDPIPADIELRAATEEPEVLPQIKDTVSPWPGSS